MAGFVVFRGWVGRLVALGTVMVLLVSGQVAASVRAGRASASTAAPTGTAGTAAGAPSSLLSPGLTLASDRSTVVAGQSFTLTASWSGLLPPMSIVITDTTTNTALKTCTMATSCAVSDSFFDAVVHSFVATAGSQSSPAVQVAGTPWTVTLAADHPVFDDGQPVQLTATANQSIGATNNSYAIYLFDQTTGTLLQHCPPQTTTTVCQDAAQVPFWTGGPHQYVAAIANNSSSVATYADLVNIKATSSVLTLTRTPWTVTLSVDNPNPVAGDFVTLSATVNQDIRRDQGYYAIYIYDQTTGEQIDACNYSSTKPYVCDDNLTKYYSGEPHEYVAVVADASGNYLPMAQLSDVQATSNIVLVAPAAWSTTLTVDHSVLAPDQTATFSLTANQDINRTNYGYALYLVNTSTGAVTATDQPTASGRDLLPDPTATTSFTTAVTLRRGTVGTYRAYLAAAANPAPTTLAALSDIRAVSNDVSLSQLPLQLTLSVSPSTFTTTDPVTFTGVLNQSIRTDINASRSVYLIDETTGKIVYYCNGMTGASDHCGQPGDHNCVDCSLFRTGGPHTYDMVVAETVAGATTKADLVTILATSNTVTLTRAPWTLTLTANARLDSGYTAVDYSATPNQSFTAVYPIYDLIYVDLTTGRIYPITPDGGIWVFAYTELFAPGDPPHAVVAMIAHWDGSTISDVQASSSVLVGSSLGPVGAGEAYGGSNPSEPGCQACRHDPIDTATGAYVSATTDIGLPGTGPALQLQRSYDSANPADTGLGVGWSFNYAAHLTPSTTTLTNGQPRTVTVSQENGATVTFVGDGNGNYLAPARVLATLTYNAASGQWTFLRRARDAMTFDATGRLLSQRDVHANTVTFSYDQAGRLASAAASGGRSLTFTWTGGHLASVTDSAGRTVSYGYDPNNNLTSVTAVDTAITTYGYDAAHRLTATTTPGGATTTNTYDSSGRVSSQTDPLGHAATFTYTAAGPDLSTTTTAPDGSKTVDTYSQGRLMSSTIAAGTAAAATTSYSYDTAANPVTVTDPFGATITSTYDAAGNRLSLTDQLGHTSHYSFDVLNDPVSSTDPTGAVTTATYDTTGNRLTLTSPGGHQQHATYNPDGTVATATDATGHHTSYSYTATGALASTTDPDGRTTSFDYDPAGRLTAATLPGGAVTASTYDPAGRPLTVTDPNNHTTHYSYTPDGQPAAVTDPTNHTTSFSYDRAGHLSATTDPLGHTTTRTYTAAGYLASVTDPDGHTTSYRYDARGDRITSTDPDNRTVSISYDKAGRPVSTVLPSGATTTTSYDAAGRLTASTDANSHTSTYSYDAAGRLLSSTDPLGRATTRSYTADGQLDVVTNPDTSTTSYSYDPAGRRTGYTDPDGHTTSFSYDPAGLLNAETLPGNHTTSYRYDTAGRLSVTTQPDSSTITRSYDAAGQLTARTYSDPATHAVSYTYDAAGRRASMSDATGTTSYSYDTAGRLTATTDGAGATVGYSYSNADRLTTLTYPGGNQVAYGYDNAGQLTSATDWANRATTFTWNTDGRLTGQADPNGVSTTTSYDPAGQATAITVGRGTSSLASYTYSYDAAGQLVSDTTTDPSTSGTTHAYTFTPTSQLASIATGTTPAATYTTTPGGQLTALADGTALSYAAGGQLAATTPASGPATSYRYTDNGQRASTTVAATGTTPAATTTYAYSGSGALTGVTLPDASTISYTSDGDGLRHTRTTSSATQHYTWGDLGDLPVLLDDGTHRYLYGPTLTPYAQIDTTTGQTDYLHGDLLGSVRLITDTAGAATATTSYDPFGNITNRTGTASSAIGYTGNYTDPATGLVYLRARDYDPATGQFLTIDPAVNTTQQPYAYTGNNPLTSTDPSGLCIVGPLCDIAYNAIEGFGNGALDATIRAFTSGPTGVIVSLARGNDPLHALLNGMTGIDPLGSNPIATIDDAISPGSSCEIHTNNLTYRLFHIVGEIAPGGIAGLAAGAVRTAAEGLTSGLEAGGAARTATALTEREIGSTMDDILQNATVKKFSTSSIYDKAGGLTQADTDFDLLTRGVTVVDRGGGLRTATLSNGTKVTVRPYSSEKLPTLEVATPGNPVLKIRY